DPAIVALVLDAGLIGLRTLRRERYTGEVGADIRAEAPAPAGIQHESRRDLVARTDRRAGLFHMLKGGRYRYQIVDPLLIIVVAEARVKLQRIGDVDLIVGIEAPRFVRLGAVGERR